MGSEGTGDGCPFQKSTFYTGKLLHATDLVREQKYGNSKLEFMNRTFYGWGIIQGLEVRPGQGGSLFLTKGSALDPQGRFLVAPRDREVKPEEIEGLGTETGQEFILGIRYAERTLGTERDYLKGGESCQPSVIEETYGLFAFGMSEYRKVRRAAIGRENILAEEKVLYENGNVELMVRMPKVVPADSLFRVRMQVRTVQDGNSSIGWHGLVRLQGAVFAQSGRRDFVLEEEPAVCSGSLQREWEICTEENRKLPVMMEICNLEIRTENGDTAEIPACQFAINTALCYGHAVKKYLLEGMGQEFGGDWVPLACMGRDGNGALSLIWEKDVRLYVTRPWEEALLSKAVEENGILDIRWRRILKNQRRSPLPPDPGYPLPPKPGFPMPPGPSQPDPPLSPAEAALTREQFWELAEEDRENRIRRGVVVIPVPRRCRKGKVLYSEEISHGFPGEEVFLWCGRVWEEPSYLYWERDRKRYRIIHGDEGLFPDVCGEQEILRQAVLQDVEAGTFQVALTLGKVRRRKRSREVAISWTAIRSI